MEINASLLKNKTPTALLLCGAGLKYPYSLIKAFQQAQFRVQVEHIEEAVAKKITIDEISRKYAVLAIGGGASYQDLLGAGKLLALHLTKVLKWDMSLFAQRGKLVLGIGNGFQALLQMGLFTEEVSMSQNDTGSICATWVRVQPVGSRCVWLKGLGSLDLPVHHQYGKILFSPYRKIEVLEKMERLGTICLKYYKNPNGSEEDVAGLCDVTGRVLGMMPHPEGFLEWTGHPEWTMQNARAASPGQGLLLFENAFTYTMGG